MQPRNYQKEALYALGEARRNNEHSGLKITNEELIAQVQMLASELGKTPGAKDFNADPRTASAQTASSRFGSWNKFLEVAGLKVNRVKKNKEE